MSFGIADWKILDTPLAIVDTETTGLYPGGDRVVEVAVVRMDPGAKPFLVLDTLLNPERPVSATEIHGITDEDVADAPTFSDIAGHFTAALKGCVFASYNVYFDAKFVQIELRQAGIRQFPPYVCLMYMRPMLGIGRKCSLADACQHHEIPRTNAHQAAADALASADLWLRYADALNNAGIVTFRQLARLKDYKFTNSFIDEPLGEDCGARIRANVRLKPRMAAPRDARLDRQPIVSEYWDALTAALADLQVTSDEVQYLRSKQAILALTPEELRWLHARAFAGILADACQDKAITEGEASTLNTVHAALQALGWAPGSAAAML